MTSTALFLSTGQPALPGLPADAPAAQRDAAWQTLLSATDPAPALAQVGGRFSVAWRQPGGRTVLATDRFGIELHTETILVGFDDGGPPGNPRPEVEG